MNISLFSLLICLNWLEMIGEHFLGEKLLVDFCCLILA